MKFNSEQKMKAVIKGVGGENNLARVHVRALEKNWVDGTIAGHSFTAKIFTEPSKFGINDGRVSKLWVRGHSPQTFINFDRGWDAGEDAVEVWEPLVAALEKFAETDEFKKSLEVENPAKLATPEDALRNLIADARKFILSMEDAEATIQPQTGKEYADVTAFRTALDRAAKAVRSC